MSSAPHSAVSLISISALPERAQLLWDLLAERNEITNISHQQMPSWHAHVRFVDSHPYQAWYFIVCDDVPVGACYLTKQDEIGVFVFKAQQGKSYGRRALELLMQRFGKRRYLANINPHNDRSAELFSRLGFQIVQHTYARV